MSALNYQIALSMFPRIGAVNARRLVAYLGSLDAVFEAPGKAFKDIPGIGNNLIKIILEKRTEMLEEALREVEFIRKHKIETYFYLNKAFPKRLAQCDDAPVILFQKGNADLNHQRIVSIVGTRSATEYGRELTGELIKGLALTGIEVLVVSGLAFGIDGVAHKAALKNKFPTIGVVGHGLDKLYPSAHKSLAREMIDAGGGILTDFPSGSKIDPGNFPRRNRIIAGLADCTIVVESAGKGGALVTADIANSYNRDVFAFPGKVSDQYSAGCNNLIKKNEAALITSAADLIAYMGWEANAKPRQQVMMIDLDDEEKQVVEILSGSEIITTDFASRKLNLSVQKINSLMLTLEFKGVLKSLPGNRFKLISNTHM
ncbi:MAG: DNA-processing protein DprA [Prolixibacteraceae bacterium]|nr:DNA-processing protein DprA [Prolixibacteraceae bacterium]